MLLANNNQKVYCNQVIAEIKKDTSLLLEEARRDIYTEVSGEVFLQNVKIKESIDSQGTVQKVSKTAGLIWVLHGERFLLQKSSKLEVKVGENFSPNSRVIGQKVRNKYHFLLLTLFLFNLGPHFHERAQALAPKGGPIS